MVLRVFIRYLPPIVGRYTDKPLKTIGYLTRRSVKGGGGQGWWRFHGCSSIEVSREAAERPFMCLNVSRRCLKVSSRLATM